MGGPYVSWVSYTSLECDQGEHHNIYITRKSKLGRLIFGYKIECLHPIVYPQREEPPHLGPLLRRVLDGALHVHAARAAAEVHVEDDVGGRVEVSQVVMDRDRLGRARLAHKQAGLARRHNGAQQPGRPAGGVRSGDQCEGGNRSQQG